MNVQVVVPRRSDGGRRDELWAFCRAWWTDRFDWPIIEAESPEGPFNRGAAINAGAELAGGWDVLLIADGDVVAEPAQVVAAVARAAETGRATFAFDTYRALDDRMTDRVLDGYAGNWAPGARLKMTSHVSSLLAVPRALWERTGGFDERVEGWGHDDTIFAHVARVIGGGLERIPGTVWHLNHPLSPERTSEPSGLRASKLLAGRYFAEWTVAGIDRLIAERQGDGVCLVVITNGRRDCIDANLPTALSMLKGLDVDRTVICDDSGDVEYQAWLRWRFPDIDLVHGHKPLGFGGAVKRAWDVAVASGQRWVFWLEDDFELRRPVDLSAMAEILTKRPHLTQMALRRQPWFPVEIAAGGVIEQDPAAYEDHADGDASWLEHAKFFTTNPCLMSRSFMAANPWPNRRGSEASFGQQVHRGGGRSGYWGARTDEPWVIHDGERIGHGY